MSKRDGEIRHLGDLAPDPANARKHNPRNIGMIVDALHEIGAARSGVIDENGTILAGNATWEALAEAGIERVKVVEADGNEWVVVQRKGLTEAQKQRLALFDNRAAELADWDGEMLAAIAQQNPEAVRGMWTPEELAAIIGEPEREVPEDPGADMDRASELQEKWQVKRGQVWQVGRHRLMCGDSTSADDVARLMGGDKVALVVTDPPYGVEYADKNAFLNTIAPGNRIQAPIAGDHETKEQTQAIWRAAFHEMAEVMAPGAVVYSFMPQGGDQMMMMMMMMMMGAGIEPRHELIWLKNNHVLGRVDYAYKHEPILYAWKAGGHKFYGDFQTSILEFPKPQKSDLHPTTKPVELIARLVCNSSLEGESIFDPFIGSGTTMVAAEQTGRICYGCEIEPKYCSVALERMAGMGITPTPLEG